MSNLFNKEHIVTHAFFAASEKPVLKLDLLYILLTKIAIILLLKKKLIKTNIDVVSSKNQALHEYCTYSSKLKHYWIL